MTTEELIRVAKNLKAENERLRDTLNFANSNLAQLWNDLERGRRVDTLAIIGAVGERIENTLNEL